MKLFLPFLIAFALVFSSCSKYLYRPEQVHDPMITEKGGIKASGGVRLSPMDKVPSIDVGLGISPLNGLVIKGALRSRIFNANETRDSVIISREHFRGRTLEGGLGYYIPVGEKEFFVVNGSFMRGRNDHYTSSEPGGVMRDSLYSNYTALSFQPAYTFHRRVLSASLGLRFSMYRYSNIFVVDANADPELYTSKNGRWFPVWDPYFNIEIGRSLIRANLQAGFSFIQGDLALKTNGLSGNWRGADALNPASFFKISVGLAVDLNYLKGKR